MKDKELLLKDLCARLPYGVKGYVNGGIYTLQGVNVLHSIVEYDIYCNTVIDEFTPYLFPITSITDGLKNFIRFKLTTPKHESFDEDSLEDLIHNNIQVVRFCYENHIDINGLIPMRLAIDATNLNIY